MIYAVQISVTVINPSEPKYTNLDPTSLFHKFPLKKHLRSHFAVRFYTTSESIWTKTIFFICKPIYSLELF